MRKKHKRLISIKSSILFSMIPIVATLLILIGNSYAVINYLYKSKNENIIHVGTLDIEVNDNGSISLVNSYPVSDSIGMSATGYEFSITNTGSLPARYLVKLEKTSGDLATTNIRYSINNSEAYTLDDSGILTIDRELINIQSTNKYNLKLWLKEDAGNDVLGKEYHARLVVESFDAGVYVDSSQAAYPKLDSNMIPIVYNSTAKEWVKVDLTQKWYDYNNKMWANVAIVSSLSNNNNVLNNLYSSDKSCQGTNGYCSRNDYLNADSGTIIPMEDISAMFVWIPRFNYTLFDSSQATKININFENALASNYSKANGVCGESLIKTSGCIYTHPAFTLGITELTGIWVGKFETGMNSVNTVDEEKTTNVFIKPNLYSLTNQQISNQYKTALSTASLYGLSLNTRVIKDTEWSAISYLTNSQYGRYNSNGECVDGGCEVWINNVYKNNNPITGCSNTVSSSDSAKLSGEINYCKTISTTDYSEGTKSSTTDNIYGVYDMSGGSMEATMATYGSATWATSRYYNTYSSLDPLTACSNDICYGYALNETSGWNNDAHNFIIANNYWLNRGNSYNAASAAGIFSYYYSQGAVNNTTGFRIVATK